MAGPHLEFVQEWVPPHYKTKLYQVRSKINQSALGYIRWFPNWRRYTFDTIGEGYRFDAACLTEITVFLNSLMEERKDGRRDSIVEEG